MDAHIDERYHAHGQKHPADAGKPRALKGACVVWRGAFGQSTTLVWQLARCLPYPKSILRVFRDKVKKKAGPGRACLEVWPQLCIATVIKHTKKKRVVQITRKITWGVMAKAQQVLQMTPGCNEFNTSLIERFNGTMRQRLAALPRKCRHAARRLETLETGMYLIGTTYNFCWPHQEVSKRKQFGYLCTPAMAAGLTDHIWSVAEVLSFKVAPALWVEPKRRGRPRKAHELRNEVVEELLLI
jgi:hypothetical protein